MKITNPPAGHDELSGVSTSDHHTLYTDANARTAVVEDTAYASGWNGDTTHAPSQNAVYDKIEAVVHTHGNNIIIGTRAAAAASGDVAYTGFGFTPTAILLLCFPTDHANGFSIGMADSGGDMTNMRLYDVDGTPGGGVDHTKMIFLNDSPGSHQQHALLASLDADGITLTWTKVNNGEAGAFAILGFRL